MTTENKIKLRVPIILVGGYLGSGKTSLINRLLRGGVDRKLAVFVNDFGAINLDEDLIETRDENKIAFKDGCVCCTLNDDFVRTITDFLRAENLPDAIVVETSGVADPRQLGTSLVALENAGLCRFDALLYLVDALNFFDLSFEDREMILEYAGCADFVLLNKSDVAIPDDLDRLERMLKEATGDVPQYRTSFGHIDEVLIFGPNLQPRRHDFVANGVDSSAHASSHSSFSAESNVPVDRETFQRLTEELAKTCYRAKGILRFEDDPEKVFYFNQVGKRATLELRPSIAETDYSASKFVAIAKASVIAGHQIDSALDNVFR